MKKANRFHVFLFLIFLFISSILTIFVNPKSNFILNEQRSRNSLPEISLDTILKGEFWKDFEAFFNDRVFAREKLVNIKNSLDYGLFRKDIISDVAISEDRTMLFRSRQEEEKEDMSLYEKDLNNWKNIKKYLDKVGTQLIVVGIPDQSDIFYDKYPKYLKNNRENYIKSSEKLTNDLNSIGIKFLNMYDDFFSNRDKLYFNADHHQNMDASMIIYEKIRKEAKIELKNLKNDISFEKLDIKFSGSHNRKLNDIVKEKSNLVTPVSKHKIEFDRFESDKKVGSYINKGGRYYNYYMGGDNENTLIDTHRDDLPNILILGDSTSNSLESIMWMAANKFRSLDYRDYKKDIISFLEQNPQDLIVVTLISGNYDNIHAIMR